MKYLLVALASLLLTCALCAENPDFNAIVADCAKELGYKIEGLNEAVKNKDNKLGCIIACAMKKFGAMTNGKLHKDFMLNMVEKEKDHNSNYAKEMESISQCYDEVTKQGNLSECDLAEKFFYCLEPDSN